MKKVITYGTFDLFHRGHYNIIKKARELGDYLIVGVTSESYDIERGKLNVQDSLLKRIENVRSTGLADEIIIEEYQGQKVNDIIKYDIDILVIGSDWRGKFDYLKNYCEVKYLPRTKDISSTKLRSERHIFRIGVVTDDDKDGGIVEETKYVSGIHVEGVYAREETLAREFSEKYELNFHTSDYEDFLSSVDIVYVKCALKQRMHYIEEAIEHGKYVISDSPITLEPEILSHLFKKAQEHKVVLVEKITFVYLRAFNQLVWLTNGDMIGKVISAKCSISQDVFGGGKSFNETVFHALCAVMKLLGKKCLEVTSNAVKDGSGHFVYDMITLKYPNALGTIEIASTLDIENSLVVTGTRGRINIPNDWWNTGYFEAKVQGNEFLKRYSFNFEGNGLRYLLQELLIIISDRRTECTRLFYEESEALVKILQTLNQKG